MRHAMLGAGAIGGLVGTMLSWIGEEVLVVVRPDKLEGYPVTLALERPTGKVMAPARVVSLIEEAVDVLWIATKSYQLQSALETVRSAPKCVVPLLNGVDHVEELRSRFGEEPVVPGTIAVEAEVVAPGQFAQRSPFARLNLAASGERLLGSVVQKLSGSGFECQMIGNEQTLLWGKLCFLAPFALVTSAYGVSIGDVLSNKRWKEQLMASVKEAHGVATACGAELDLAKIQDNFGKVPATMRSSMQKDLAAGREIELDAIGGPILRGGKKFGVDVPATAELAGAVAAKVETEPQQPEFKI